MKKLVWLLFLLCSPAFAIDRHAVASSETSDFDGSPLTTASLTFTSGRVPVIFCTVFQASGAPSVSGGSVTWAAVAGPVEPVPDYKIYALVASGPATSGALTVTYAGSDFAHCFVEEISAANTADLVIDTNVATSTGTSASPTVTLPNALENSANRAYGVVAQETGTFTAGANITAGTAVEGLFGAFSFWPMIRTTSDLTLAGTSNLSTVYAAIALEIDESAGGSVAPKLLLMQQQ